MNIISDAINQTIGTSLESALRSGAAPNPNPNPNPGAEANNTDSSDRAEENPEN